jgi:hypothetical protein
MKTKLNEQQKEIVNLYTSGQPSTKIAKQYNCSYNLVLKILKENNIPIRPKSLRQRKYQINEFFFDNIDTELKAYFLGLMYADGNVMHTAKGYTSSLVTGEDDKCLVDKLNELLFDSKKPLCVPKKEKPHHKNRYYLYINNEQIGKSLIKHGCIPNKHHKIRLPQFIPYPLINHFIRGFFDGDGCVTGCKRYKFPFCSIVFTSNHDFCDDLRLFFKPLNIIMGLLKDKNYENSWQLRGSSFQTVLNFYKFLYQNATFFLKRKHDKIYSYLKQKNAI